MMKKTFIIILGLVCILLTGCKKSMVGVYDFVQRTNGDEVLTEYDLKGYGITYELVVEENKKATLKEGDTITNLTYDDEKFVGKNEENNEERILKYTFDGNQIILDEKQDKLFFQRKKQYHYYYIIWLSKIFKNYN